MLLAYCRNSREASAAGIVSVRGEECKVSSKNLEACRSFPLNEGGSPYRVLRGVADVTCILTRYRWLLCPE